MDAYTSNANNPIFRTLNLAAQPGAACLPADELKSEETLIEKTQSPPSQVYTAETRCNINPTAVSKQAPENTEIFNEKEKQEPVLLGHRPSEELLKSGSVGEAFRTDAQKPPAFPVDKPELPSVDDKPEKSRRRDLRSPSTVSLSTDIQENFAAADVETRLLPQSEEEDEEEDDEPMKEHHLDIKQELQGIKPELLLDEMSSSSGFLGSPGEPDAQLSMELGLVPASRSCADNLTETDDSLSFEALRSDREKVKRRGSPGRSRVKQVRSP